MASDANGVPFNGSWVVASGNLAADMYANVMAESTGRLLATRLWESTDDPGMKDMLAFLIARDTMHQNQWLAVLEELGGPTGGTSDTEFFSAKSGNAGFQLYLLFYQRQQPRTTSSTLGIRTFNRRKGRVRIPARNSFWRRTDLESANPRSKRAGRTAALACCR